MTMQWVGWGAAGILLVTIGRQVWTQWQSRSSAGVSKWLFVGQVAASIGFIVYSVAQGDAVFIVTNSLMLLTAILGEVVYWVNRRRHPKE